MTMMVPTKRHHCWDKPRPIRYYHYYHHPPPPPLLLRRHVPIQMVTITIMKRYIQILIHTIMMIRLPRPMGNVAHFYNGNYIAPSNIPIRMVVWIPRMDHVNRPPVVYTVIYNPFGMSRSDWCNMWHIIPVRTTDECKSLFFVCSRLSRWCPVFLFLGFTIPMIDALFFSLSFSFFWDLFWDFFHRFDWYVWFDGDCDQLLDRTGHVELTSDICTKWDHTHYGNIDLCLYTILSMLFTHGQYD